MISDSVELWRNGSLFLTHPTFKNKCMTSRNAQCSSWSGFGIFKISRKVRVLKQSQSALLSSISHITMLFVFTLCDEYMKSIDSAVCHKLWSILWWIGASLFTDHRISGRPIRAKYKHFRTILRRYFGQFSNRFCFFFFEVVVIDAWSRYFCCVVASSCLSTHNIVPHISWHDLPYRRTKKKYEDFPSMVVFQFPPRKFVIQTWLCNCQQYLCLFHIVFEYIPEVHDQKKMLVLPNQLLYWVLSTSDQDFVSFQPILCHPHTQRRIILFHDEQRDIPNLEFSPSHVSIGFSQIAFPITVLAKDDRTDSAQEEQLGLQYWTMI